MTDERATERLVRAREHTDERGRATAEVVAEPYADGETLHVPIEVLTTGDRHALSFRLPRTWEESTPVVRFVESVGYGPGGLDMLVGERFPVELGGETPAPVFDDGDEREAGAEGRGDAAVAVVPIRAAAVGVGRLLRRAAVYAGLIAVFAVHVSVGALVAAAVTSVAVFAGFLIATALGRLGAVGALGGLLGLVALGALVAIGTGRKRPRRRDAPVSSDSRRALPELLRDR